ncbi:response regulator receiver protein [Denitrovibrio acetiphilus DSM 12809]|uniref:Response regulator receiver protein n=1 Tax=Denitrovibrio acetiphilus (strain DSM 12809 / NBRC 114555 / N2460) TaxID=522772 RepID=D4H595_DENA2|nr:response regulator [Denitrovibrio acetiphilus]ADD67515.1 response regulator receiver protein [Denitrovibrio acetiphilus DSM 12809]
MRKLEDINLLYVEDEKFTRMLVKKLLEKENIKVHEAANGVLGLKKFYEISPDIIVTDLAMPEMDGFEMISKIREKNNIIPIIITTAYREEAERVNDMVTDCIFKPIIKDDLVKAIQKIVSA